VILIISIIVINNLYGQTRELPAERWVGMPCLLRLADTFKTFRMEWYRLAIPEAFPTPSIRSTIHCFCLTLGTTKRTTIPALFQRSSS
jgi:hypothetical protein